MIEGYTLKARRVIFFSRYEASQYGSPYIETEHLLLGLLREDRAIARRFLGQGNIQEEIRAEIEGQRLGHRHVGTEHLLLWILREESSLAARLLQAKGLKASAVREQLAKAFRPSVVSVRTGRDPQAKLKLASFLAGLKSSNSEDLIQFFAKNAQFIDVFGKCWNREEIFKSFEALFAPYAKKNATPLVEQTLVEASDVFVAGVLWKNAILASQERIWIHRMTVVLIREEEDWLILLMHVTPVQPV